jgi:hypothetical protein
VLIIAVLFVCVVVVIVERSYSPLCVVSSSGVNHRCHDFSCEYMIVGSD